MVKRSLNRKFKFKRKMSCHKRRVLRILMFLNKSLNKKRSKQLMLPKKLQRISKFNLQCDNQQISEGLNKPTNLPLKFKSKSNPKLKQLQTSRFKRTNF